MKDSCGCFRLGAGACSFVHILHLRPRNPSGTVLTGDDLDRLQRLTVGAADDELAGSVVEAIGAFLADTFQAVGN